MRVADIIDSCNTGLAQGLSIQLIAKLNRMVKTPLLVKIDHPRLDTSSSSVNAYLQPSAAANLIQAAKSRGKKLVINSCLRTTVQQHIIRRQFENGLCGITAAALPGRSNHERGAAVDIQDPEDWQDCLEAHSWSKLGNWDNIHYDYWDARKDIASLQISAFQMLWNQYNPNNPIAVDGTYGAITAAKIDLSPVDGWV
jgi:N-acetylmuramoyl-L-alanine amidase